MSIGEKPKPDSECINIMRQGAYEVCEQAICKWWNDKYQMGHEVNQQYIKEWKLTRDRIGELCAKLNNMVKEELV